MSASASVGIAQPRDDADVGRTNGIHETVIARIDDDIRLPVEEQPEIVFRIARLVSGQHDANGKPLRITQPIGNGRGSRETVACRVTKRGSTRETLNATLDDAAGVGNPEDDLRLFLNGQADVIVYTGDNGFMNAIGAAYIRVVAWLTYAY